MKKVLFTLLVFGLCYVNSAHADWRNTRWGMTVKEVSEATGEVARSMIGNNATEGGIRMSRHYEYAPDSKGLVRVVMSPYEMQDCANLLTAIQDKYGTDSLPNIDQKWDEKNGTYLWDCDENTVIYFKTYVGISRYESKESLYRCSIIYQQKGKDTPTRGKLKDVL